MNYAEVKQAIESGDREIYTTSDGQDDGVCPVCHGTTWEEIEVDTSDVYGEGTTGKAVIPCRACNGGHARKVSDALIVADIPEGRSLADFDWTLYGQDTSREKKIVNTFVDRFSEFERDGLGLYLTSKTRGSGKTFLASCIGWELINRYETSIRFVNASDLLEISKEKRDNGGDPLDDLISARVLILDDLGQKLTGRDWLTDVLFRIIDKRYQQKRTMIVTSNVDLKELNFDDRVVDRLYAMTVLVKIPEYCVRAREANTRKRSILQKFGID